VEKRVRRLQEQQSAFLQGQSFIQRGTSQQLGGCLRGIYTKQQNCVARRRATGDTLIGLLLIWSCDTISMLV
jgi:hypothetical protein